MPTSLDWLIARPIAHRGLHDTARGLIENTAGAVRAAIEASGWHDGIDFLFADLGVSSMQIDDAARKLATVAVAGDVDLAASP